MTSYTFILYSLYICNKIHHKNEVDKLTNIKTLWLRNHKNKFPLAAKSESAKNIANSIWDEMFVYNKKKLTNLALTLWCFKYILMLQLHIIIEMNGLKNKLN